MAINELLHDAKHLEKSYRSVLSLMDYLSDVDGLEKAKATAEVQLAEAREKTVFAVEKYTEAQGQLDSVYGEITEAKNKADEIISVAKAKALYDTDQILTNEKNLVDAARREIENYREQIRVESESHEARMEKANAEYERVSAKLDTLNTELAELRKRVG